MGRNNLNCKYCDYRKTLARLADIHIDWMDCPIVNCPYAEEQSEADAALKWNKAEDGHFRLNGCPCIHDGCEGCPVEQCYSYPAPYDEEG